LISSKNTFTKYKKQDTHWAACNSEIAHSECICDENTLKWKCKNNNDELTDKELCTESITARETQNTETELFSKAVRDVSDN